MWINYSNKLKAKIENPICSGTLEEKENARVVQGEDGTLKDDFFLRFYLHIDESDGMVIDAKFLAFGPAAILGIAQGACELMIKKNYIQVRRINMDLLEKHLRDKSSIPALPEEESFPLLKGVITAIDEATSKCMDIPIEVSSPLPDTIASETYPDFETLNKAQKMILLENVIQEEIRPYIELDEGNIKLIDLEGNILTISYEGSCTTCPSSTGATLGAIQGLLQTKVHKDLLVKPQFSH